jgi:hypothetical protein
MTQRTVSRCRKSKGENSKAMKKRWRGMQRSQNTPDDDNVDTHALRILIFGLDPQEDLLRIPVEQRREIYAS